MVLRYVSTCVLANCILLITWYKIGLCHNIHCCKYVDSGNRSCRKGPIFCDVWGQHWSKGPNWCCRGVNWCCKGPSWCCKRLYWCCKGPAICWVSTSLWSTQACYTSTDWKWCNIPRCPTMLWYSYQWSKHQSSRSRLSHCSVFITTGIGFALRFILCD